MTTTSPVLEPRLSTTLVKPRAAAKPRPTTPRQRTRFSPRLMAYAGAGVLAVAGLAAGWTGIALVVALAVASFSTWLVLFTETGIGD